jgi:transposase
MARFDLSDAEWTVIRPLLPNKPRGVARVDDRRVINGIFYVLAHAHQHAAGGKKGARITPSVVLVAD